MAGRVAEVERAAATETLVKNLTLAARQAAPLGLTILLEPLNPNDNPGYFYSTVEAVVAVIERVAAPNLKLMFDAYHVGRAEGDVLTRLHKFWKHIGHVQIAAVPSRAEPDEGEIAYGAIFKALENLGYAGWSALNRLRSDTTWAFLGEGAWRLALAAAFRGGAASGPTPDRHRPVNGRSRALERLAPRLRGA
jgi:hydroxypyruvate isomerase